MKKHYTMAEAIGALEFGEVMVKVGGITEDYKPSTVHSYVLPNFGEAFFYDYANFCETSKWRRWRFICNYGCEGLREHQKQTIGVGYMETHTAIFKGIVREIKWEYYVPRGYNYTSYPENDYEDEVLENQHLGFRKIARANEL